MSSDKIRVSTFDKIAAGFQKASLKLLEERAANNDTVVIGIEGHAKIVPAKELLEKRRNGSHQ